MAAISIAEIGNRRKDFELLGASEKEFQREFSKKEWIKDFDWKSIRRPCPACGELAVLNTEVVKFLDSAAGEDSIIERAVVQPNRLRCRCCSLELNGYGAMAEAGLSEQTISENHLKPEEYYGIEYKPNEYSGEDYGND